jgi:Enoyl-(Acyl carrier protein) reductase
LRRFGDHRELADLYAYLASKGSGYITGDVIVIDGGRWMQGVGGPTFRAMQDWDDTQWEAMRGQGRKA